jgi:hypothetical protein
MSGRLPNSVPVCDETCAGFLLSAPRLPDVRETNPEALIRADSRIPARPCRAIPLFTSVALTTWLLPTWPLATHYGLLYSFPGMSVKIQLDKKKIALGVGDIVADFVE